MTKILNSIDGKTTAWYLCECGASPLVYWDATADTALHSVFLQHNGLLHSKERRTNLLKTFQPTYTK